MPRRAREWLPDLVTDDAACRALGFGVGTRIHTPLGLEAVVVGCHRGRLFVRYADTPLALVSPLPFPTPGELSSLGYRALSESQLILHRHATTHSTTNNTTHSTTHSTTHAPRVHFQPTMAAELSASHLRASWPVRTQLPTISALRSSSALALALNRESDAAAISAAELESSGGLVQWSHAPRSRSPPKTRVRVQRQTAERSRSRSASPSRTPWHLPSPLRQPVSVGDTSSFEVHPPNRRPHRLAPLQHDSAD
eukprot:TRINITY_DN18820_c0_g1_i1.p1 TRINITY_DN18820_c0_g1~~TRINITY_DN18820_c0_g1_i1.p1  ORF type:complete len:253 (+),score=28.57 TRINITY_DN18820_c0_g1_i1:96-854(+)